MGTLLSGSASFGVEIAAEGDGSVFLEVFGTDGRFGGFSEAWVGYQDLERFATELKVYPLRSPVILGAGRSASGDELRDIRLEVRQVTSAGQLAMQVQLECEVSSLNLAGRNRTGFEYLTTYGDLARFAEELIRALRSGKGRAELRWEFL